MWSRSGLRFALPPTTAGRVRVPLPLALFLRVPHVPQRLVPALVSVPTSDRYKGADHHLALLGLAAHCRTQRRNFPWHYSAGVLQCAHTNRCAHGDDISGTKQRVRLRISAPFLSKHLHCEIRRLGAFLGARFDAQQTYKACSPFRCGNSPSCLTRPQSRVLIWTAAYRCQRSRRRYPS